MSFQLNSIIWEILAIVEAPDLAKFAVAHQVKVDKCIQ